MHNMNRSCYGPRTLTRMRGSHPPQHIHPCSVNVYDRESVSSLSSPLDTSIRTLFRCHLAATAPTLASNPIRPLSPGDEPRDGESVAKVAAVQRDPSLTIVPRRALIGAVRPFGFHRNRHHKYGSPAYLHATLSGHRRADSCGCRQTFTPSYHMSGRNASVFGQ
jgi:hypothetical protein